MSETASSVLPLRRGPKGPRALSLTCFLLLFSGVLVALGALAAGQELDSNNSTVTTVVGQAWLSSPAAMWTRVIQLSNNPFMNLGRMLTTDFTDALTAAYPDTFTDSLVSVAVPTAATAANPSGVGAYAEFTVSSTTLTYDEIISGIRSASYLQQVSAVFSAVVPARIKVLKADAPEDLSPYIASQWIPISGATIVWDILVNMLGDSSRDLVLAPMLMDLQNAIDNTQDNYLVGISGSVANSTALFLEYTVYLLPSFRDAVQAGSATPLSHEEVHAKFMGSQFPTFNEVLPKLAPLVGMDSTYLTVMGLPVVPREPLRENPSPAPEPPTIVVQNVSCSLVLHFGGSSLTWQHVLDSASSVLSAELLVAATDGLSRSTFETTVSVVDMRVQQDTKKKIDELLVDVVVVQGVTNASGSRRTWAPLEVASMLTNYANYSSVYDLYDGFATPAETGGGGVFRAGTSRDNSDGNGTGTGEERPPRRAGQLLAIGMAEKYSLTCTSTCIGMIAMGTIVGAVTLIVLAVGLLALCCCYGGLSGNDEKRGGKKCDLDDALALSSASGEDEERYGDGARRTTSRGVVPPPVRTESDRSASFSQREASDTTEVFATPASPKLGEKKRKFGWLTDGFTKSASAKDGVPTATTAAAATMGKEEERTAKRREEAEKTATAAQKKKKKGKWSLFGKRSAAREAVPDGASNGDTASVTSATSTAASEASLDERRSADSDEDDAQTMPTAQNAQETPVDARGQLHPQAQPQQMAPQQYQLYQQQQQHPLFPSYHNRGALPNPQLLQQQMMQRGAPLPPPGQNFGYPNMDVNSFAYNSAQRRGWNGLNPAYPQASGYGNNNNSSIRSIRSAGSSSGVDGGYPAPPQHQQPQQHPFAHQYTANSASWRLNNGHYGYQQ